jgi:hypothetical protein
MRQASPFEASTSDAARQDAIRSIPRDKLSQDDWAKVESVASNITIFRRLPVKIVDCDPDLYLFAVRHPDAVVNIWELLKISRLELRQLEENRFRVVEPSGAVGGFEYLYRGHDVHVIYGEGSYEGPLMARPVKGRGLLVLKTGYVRETNDRYYVTSRLDCFLSIDQMGVDLLAKTVSPLMGRTMDHNFAQTISFISSLSRTAELNGRGVQRLGSQLSHVRPETREQFLQVAAKAGQKMAAQTEPPLETADRSTGAIRR